MMRVLITWFLLVMGVSVHAQLMWGTVNYKSKTEYVPSFEFPDITGLTYAAVGNSITQCCSGCSFVYTTVLTDSTNLGTITNRGVSGNTMARLPGVRVGFRTQVIQSYGNDIISIFGGTNDWVFDVPIGNTTDHNDTNNVCGAANYFLDLLETNSPESIVFFIIPLTRSRDQAGIEQSYEPINNLGYTVQAYGDSIKAVCEARDIPYLNLYQISGFLFADIDTWAADGLHPNNTGQMKLGRYIKYYMLNQDVTNLY